MKQSKKSASGDTNSLSRGFLTEKDILCNTLRMASVFLVIVFVVLVFLLIYKYVTFRPSDFPPGPPRIPLFGSYLFLLLANPKYLHKGALFFSRVYKSSIIGMYLGDFPTVVINDAAVVKEVLNRKDFDGRPDIFMGRLRDPNYEKKGIFFVDGPVWKDQRRFVLRYLRDFGFGRRFTELEIIMNEEISEMIDLIKNGPKYPHDEEIFKKGEALCPYFFGPFTTNGFLHVMCGERFERKDQGALIELTKQAMIFQRNGDDYGRLLSLMPWIRYFFPNISGFKPLRKSSEHLHKFFKDIADKYIETFDENHTRNFLDLHIAELKKSSDLDESYFQYDQMVLNLLDFAFPAITAIGVQMSLLFQWFLLRPDILKKVQQEIDEVVGRGRLPSLDDRVNMPYTEATVRECLRRETLVPSSIPHKALFDTELRGYKIPKDCFIVPSLYAMHEDKDMWGDPHEFRPERFLDENGKLCLKKDTSLPFGAGKRLCAGETFARNFLFLMTGAICQNFDVVLKPGEKLPDPSKNPSGIVISPNDFWCKLQER